MLNTNQKVLIARTLSHSIVFARRCCGLPSKTVVKRGNVFWDIDLKEGVDLSIYVLGGFEPRTLRRYREYVAEGDVVFDIGANIGSHVLPLAQLVGSAGKIVAFEPTRFAFEKLQRNIALNPHLEPRITLNQTMLVSDDADGLPEAIYSSWPLDAASDLHPEHQGRLKSTDGSRAQTLDSYSDMHKVSRLDFIKLDVDGHEHEVLQGSSSTLKKFRPNMMLELAPYVYATRPDVFDSMLERLWSAGYILEDVATRVRLPHDPVKVRLLIPKYGAMNVLGFTQ